jgi:hypothetical protein
MLKLVERKGTHFLSGVIPVEFPFKLNVFWKIVSDVYSSRGRTRSCCGVWFFRIYLQTKPPAA